MKQIIDNNFLNGTLVLIVDEDRKRVTGQFKFYNELFDDFFIFEATSKCKKGDVFSEKVGIDIVCTKLARQYHKMYMNNYAADIRYLESILKELKELHAFRERKVLNIEEDLKRQYELTFFRNKRVNKTKEKTTKKETK